MRKSKTKIIYHLTKYSGFESKEGKLFDTLSLKDNRPIVKIGGCNPLEFADLDSLIDAASISFKDKTKIRTPIIRRAVFCFTRDVKNKNLWETKEIAIGISIDYIKKIEEEHNLKLSEVLYTDEKPKLPPFSIDEIFAEKKPEIEKWISKVISTKLKKFEPEKEIRFWGIIKNIIDEKGIYKIISLPIESINEIILGYNMSDEVKEKTIYFCKEYLPHAQIKETYEEKGEIEIRDFK